MSVFYNGTLVLSGLVEGSALVPANTGVDRFSYTQYERISYYNGSTTKPTYETFVSGDKYDMIARYRLIERAILSGYEYEKGSFIGTINTYNDGYQIRRRAVTDYVGNFAASYIGNYTRVTSTVNYARNYLRTSTTTYEGNYLRTSTTSYTGNYARNFTRTFVGNYSRNFTRTRSSNYLGGEGYTRDFVGNFVGDYTRDFTATFEGNYSRNYVGNFIGNYGRNFLGNYNRTFTGDYIGEQIGSGSTNIETYTLYVRTA